jgi:hypothetical protein
MVATMSVRFDFGGADGAPGTNQDVDALGPASLRFKLADNATIDQNNGMVIPGVGLGPYYSCWKHVYLYCDNPDGHTINNVKLYSDGSSGYGTGVTLSVGLQFPIKNSGSSAGYEVAHAAVGNTSDELVAGHGGITTKASIFAYTVGAGALAITISEAGAVINLTGETANYVLLQVAIADTASPGQTASETFTFSYDEA